MYILRGVTTPDVHLDFCQTLEGGSSKSSMIGKECDMLYVVTCLMLASYNSFLVSELNCVHTQSGWVL